MENSALFLCYLTAVLIFLNVHQVQPVEVKLTSKPWISRPVYETSTVNFTYRFSNLSMVKKIKFGTCINDHTLEEEIISVTQKKDGNITVSTQNSKTYEGRIRWVGDVSRTLAKFEFSDIKISESGIYGLEIHHGDGYRMRCTEINVKELPRLSISHDNVTCVKGKSANFSWNYTLTKDNTNALSFITFGIYKDGTFRIICIVQVENATMKRPNCSTGARKRSTSFDSEVKIPTNTVKFVLNQVDLDDEAEYSIRLGGPWQNIIENKKRLIVTVPPKFTEVPQSTSVVEGRTLNLTCMADGRPRPLITWLKDGEKLRTNSTTHFTLQYIAREDAGQYQCVAQNDLRIVTSSKAIVDVLYVPSINTSSKMKTIEAPIGTEMWLNCPTTANPPATLQWFKNGIPKEKGTDKFHVFIDSFYNDANYTCVAKNSVGEDYVTFNFRKVGPPSSPKVDCERQDDSMNSRWLIFRWNSPKDDGGAPILWYNVKHRSFVKLSEKESQKWINTNITNNITWYRFDLTWQRSFEFTITAWNKYGESKLDLDNTCLITVGKDPAAKGNNSTTEMPSQKVVAEPTTIIFSKDQSSSDSKCTPIVAASVTINVVLVLVLVFLAVYIWRGKNNKARTAQRRRSSKIVKEEAGVYENPHQIEATSLSVSSHVSGKEFYETIKENRGESGNTHHAHSGHGETKVNTTRSPPSNIKGSLSSLPQHNQELRRETPQPTPLYEPLDQNTDDAETKLQADLANLHYNMKTIMAAIVNMIEATALSVSSHVSGKEFYETVKENRGESGNAHHSYSGHGETKVNTTRSPPSNIKGSLSSLPQHYQELRRETPQPIPLDEPLDQKTDGTETYEQLQQNKQRREYQSLRKYTNVESKV